MHFEIVDKEERTMKINGTLMSIDTMEKAIMWFYGQTYYKEYIEEVINNCYNGNGNVVIDINEVPEYKLIAIASRFANMKNDRVVKEIYECEEDIMRECIEDVLNVDAIWNLAYVNDDDIDLPF